MHCQLLFDRVVRCAHFDKALARELEGILDEINEHLLQPDQVAKQKWQFVVRQVMHQARVSDPKKLSNLELAS